jgi:hypothetical protein
MLEDSVPVLLRLTRTVTPTEGGSSDEHEPRKLAVDDITMEERNTDSGVLGFEIWGYVWMKRIVN